MMIFRQKEQIRAHVTQLRAENQTVAFVPTMGGLHDGHLSLVRRASEKADHIVVSIYVNPAQFAAHEDLDDYPRTFEADCAKLDAMGFPVSVYAPLSLYGPDDATKIVPAGAALPFEGEMRPQFFTGVATVVMKLFSHVPADMAFFGEKDFQQLCVIKQMVRDFDLPIEIQACPTARDQDGLAQSSRNLYLSHEERVIAPILYQSMRDCAAAVSDGMPVPQACEAAKATLFTAGFASVDYIAWCAPDDLTYVTNVSANSRLLVAAHLGKTRLIDNECFEKLCNAQ